MHTFYEIKADIADHTSWCYIGDVSRRMCVSGSHAYEALLRYARQMRLIAPAAIYTPYLWTIYPGRRRLSNRRDLRRAQRVILSSFTQIASRAAARGAATLFRPPVHPRTRARAAIQSGDG